MSHVVTSPVIITSLACLKRAVASFGKLHWCEGQKTHRWYGRWVKDYHMDDAAYKLGIDPKTYGKCEHAIRVDGSNYDIGVVKRKDGKGYSLVWDFFGTGRQINEVIGDGAEHLLVAYQKEYLQQFAEEQGLTFSMEVSGEEMNIEMEQTL